MIDPIFGEAWGLVFFYSVTGPGHFPVNLMWTVRSYSYNAEVLRGPISLQALFILLYRLLRLPHKLKTNSVPRQVN